MGVVYCLLYVSDMAFSANDKGNSDESFSFVGCSCECLLFVAVIRKIKSCDIVKNMGSSLLVPTLSNIVLYEKKDHLRFSKT